MSERPRTPATERNRYADLLRVVAIGGVIYGHWLLISVTYADGRMSGVDALDYIEWGRWVTWLFQVMPVFFLVGGYVNAQSWMAHRARGETWTQWVRDRVLRLLWPTAVYLVVAELAVLVARAAGAPVGEVAEAGWLAAVQLWFLPVYMVLIALTPVLLAAHHRWGLAVPAVMAVAAGAVDTAGPHPLAIGYLNYVFVWGCIHQWGFAWQDRTLTSPRWRIYVLAAGGAALLAGLLASRAFRVDMVGSGNTNPPSIALLAFAAVQSALVLAAEPRVSGVLSGERPWRLVQRLNAQVMNAYLWHFVPVIVIVVAFYPTGVLPQPAIGSAEWWELRLAWWALLTVVLVPLVSSVTLVERPMLRLPEGLGRPGPWSPALLLAGIASAGAGLSELAISGFLPGGSVPVLALALCAIGLVAALFTGRARAWGTRREAVPQAPAALCPGWKPRIDEAAGFEVPVEVARSARRACGKPLSLGCRLRS
jgi:fucose 4-O-acetylase-like acetyltransferase